jgi:uncharacterized protein YjbI with pentapeptide repeats
VKKANLAISRNYFPGVPSSYQSLTAAQLYSTASYKMKDLTDITFDNNNLTGWNFADQNLTGASFRNAILTDANLSHANLAQVFLDNAVLKNANLSQTNLTNIRFNSALDLGNVNLSGADMRGTNDYYYFSATTTMTNLIRNDGSIQGLDLSGARTLIVRDYDGDPGYNSLSFYILAHGPIAITVQNSMNMGADGVLNMIFEEDAWDSKISFAPGIPVALGGTLDLTFADGIDVSGQVGRTFSLFDWTDVTPTGTFAIDSPYAWDTSNLYATGDVTLLAVPEPANIAIIMGLLGLLFFRHWVSKCR